MKQLFVDMIDCFARTTCSKRSRDWLFGTFCTCVTLKLAPSVWSLWIHFSAHICSFARKGRWGPPLRCAGLGKHVHSSLCQACGNHDAHTSFRCDGHVLVLFCKHCKGVKRLKKPVFPRTHAEFPRHFQGPPYYSYRHSEGFPALAKLKSEGW